MGIVKQSTHVRMPAQRDAGGFNEMRGLESGFRLAVDHIPGLVWSALPDGFIEFLNLRWLEYTGMSHENACGWGWLKAVHPDDLPGLLTVWRGLLATCRAGETEARLRSYNGSYRWFLFRALPLYDSAGSLLKWYGQTTDIEDLKRAEALLAAEKHLLELIANGSPLASTLDVMCRMVDTIAPGSLSAVLLLGPSGKLSHAAAPNVPKAFADRIDGSEVHGGIGPCGLAVITRQPVFINDLAHDPLWPLYRKLALPYGLRACFSTPILASDGTVLGTLALHSRVPGAPSPQQQTVIGQFTHLAAVAVERKRTEEALRVSQERFALAVAASADGIWDWDIDTDAMFMSERAQRIYGLEPAAAMRPGAEWRAMIRLHVEDAEVLARLLKEYLLGTTPVFDGEWRVRLADGSHRWVRIRGLCVRNAAGRATRLAGSVSDIDTQKRTEAALGQARRLEAMGTLAGGIAHDFNNILGVVLGYGEMALRGAIKGSRLRRDLDSIMSAGERGRALVDRILAFSRSGMSERIAVHVEEIVREALELLRAGLPPGIEVETRLAAGRAAMLGDATQVHQVVMNLVTNAVQAMPGGGVLRVSLDAATLETPRIATTGMIDSGVYLVLRIADSGTGIALDVLDRIFDPFFTTKEIGVGTGLGLSLVHGIVTEVGGAIDVASMPGKGSTFTVYLPRAGVAAHECGCIEPPLPRGAGQRVMVIDDEEPLARLAAETLAELGYTADCFTSSAAALAAFRENPSAFDAVLTDERMPGMSGSALIVAMRQARAEIPVLLMSGYLGDAGGRGAPADEILKKPLAVGDLAKGLARVLRRR